MLDTGFTQVCLKDLFGELGVILWSSKRQSLRAANS